MLMWGCWSRGYWGARSNGCVPLYNLSGLVCSARNWGMTVNGVSNVENMFTLTTAQHTDVLIFMAPFWRILNLSPHSMWTMKIVLNQLRIARLNLKTFQPTLVGQVKLSRNDCFLCLYKISPRSWQAMRGVINAQKSGLCSSKYITGT